MLRVVLGAVLLTLLSDLVHGSSVTDIRFDSPARVWWAADHAPSEVFFACSSSGCVPLPATSGSILIDVRREGDYVRVIDSTFHTHQWVVWGSPNVPWSRDVMWDIARKHGCMDTWLATISSWRGVTRSSSGVWTHMKPATTPSCLATMQPMGGGGGGDGDGGQDADDKPWIAMHLSVASRRNLVFSRWITRGRLQCDAIPGDRLDAPDAVDIWLSTEEDPHAFWTYARERHAMTCATNDALRAQVASVIGCLQASTLQSSPTHRAWMVPFYPTANDDDVDNDDASDRAVSKWHAQRLYDWTQKWKSTSIPIFLCANQYGDTTTFHSMVLLFDPPTTTHPFRLRSTPPVDTRDVLLELALPSFVAPCPAYFLI